MNILYTNSLLSFVKKHFHSILPFLTFKKTWNLLLAIVEMKIRRSRCFSKPAIYRIDPCTACNIYCPGCDAHTAKISEKRLLSLQDFKNIIDSTKNYCIRASLYDAGEPLMNKNIYKMIKYASDNKISTSISTNFNLFKKEKHLEALMNSGLTVLQPDLDGITQETYSTYRVGGDVSTVLKGIEAVVEHKKKTGLTYPLVEPQIIMFKHVMPEKKSINDYLSKLGVDQIIWKRDTWGFNPVEESINSNSRTKSKRCFWLYLGIMIRPNGDVFPCAGKGLNRFSYGNIHEHSIENIWNNKYFQFSRLLFKKGPPLAYDSNMEQLPCHTCEIFQKERIMQQQPREEKLTFVPNTNFQ